MEICVISNKEIDSSNPPAETGDPESSTVMFVRTKDPFISFGGTDSRNVEVIMRASDGSTAGFG